MFFKKSPFHSFYQKKKKKKQKKLEQPYMFQKATIQKIMSTVIITWLYEHDIIK